MVKKGFTLIELLIVIGILAVLAVAVVITLNPAELLRQARDSTRISDIAAIKSSIALYIVDQTDPKFGDSALCFPSLTSVTGFTAGCDPDGAATTYGPRFTVAAPNPVATAPAAVTATDGTGWIRVNIAAISAGSGGAPISALPLDPTNNAGTNLFYAYRAGGAAGCNDTTTPRCTVYEINVPLESTKFGPQLTNDGGDSASLYEAGTDPGLNL